MSVGVGPKVFFSGVEHVEVGVKTFWRKDTLSLGNWSLCLGVKRMITNVKEKNVKEPWQTDYDVKLLEAELHALQQIRTSNVLVHSSY